MSPDELIYAQPVDIKPVGKPIASIPIRGPPRAYGSPKPMPYPPRPYKGPPKRIGYGGNIRPGFSEKYGQASSGNFQFSQNSALYNDATYLSKPPPGYSNENPYTFDNNRQGVYNKPPSIPLSPTNSKTESVVQQHVHHHYVHSDGDKDPKVIIKPVAIPVGSVGSIASHQQVQQATDIITAGGADFSGIGTGGFKPMTGSYPFDNNKPVYESETIYGTKYQQQNFNKGSNNILTQGLPGPYGNNGFDEHKYGNSLGSYSSTDFYKKEFNVGTTNNLLNSGPATFNQNNAYLQQYHEGKAQSFDCVCVNYDQCPSQEIIGRRDDLYLPIDPRNKGSNIDALTEEQLDNVTIADKKIDSNVTVVEPEKFTESEAVKKVSKREIKEEKAGEATKEIEPVSIVNYYIY